MIFNITIVAPLPLSYVCCLLCKPHLSLKSFSRPIVTTHNDNTHGLSVHGGLHRPPACQRLVVVSQSSSSSTV